MTQTSPQKTALLTFLAITLFYFFESAQMSYFNVLAPFANHQQIASLSAAYYYGDMVGLLPVGFALDRFPLRKILLWAIAGSIASAFLLITSSNFYVEWIARFLCGFFGGTFSFLGGIRIIANSFSNRFTFYMGLFLSAGMLGGLVCQYPLLLTVQHFGPWNAMMIMAMFGLLVGLINFIYLHPATPAHHAEQKKYPGTVWKMCKEIISNRRNWFDCLMIVLLDTPVSIVGTLWGIVLLVGFYHFSAAASAWIVMSLFIGLMIGLPMWGATADRYQHPAWIIILGAGGSFLMFLLMLLFPNASAPIVALLFFLIGFLSSCQTLGFTWLTQNMRPELIGRNSAFNSMIFMGANGGLKQVCAILLSTTTLYHTPSGNLLILMAVAMLLSTTYALLRKK